MSIQVTIAPGDRVVPWINQCSPGWPLKPLKYAAEINARTLGENIAPDYEINYIDISSVDANGQQDPAETMTFGDAPSRARRIVASGDVIISTVRTYLKAISYIENANDNLICSTGFAVITASPQVYPKFLFYWVRCEWFVNEIVARSVGVSYPAINAIEIGSLPFPAIQVEEQQAIADFLDHETTSINELIARKQRLIDLLREQRTALITRTVTKGLNPDAPMKYSGVEWLGKIPEHWEVKKLKWTITSCSNGIWGDEETGENDVVCIRVADFDRMRLKVVEDNLTWRSIPSNMLSRRKLQKGDLLLEKSGGGEQQPVGAVVIYELDYEAVCSNFIACMKIADGHNSRLLNYFHYALYSSGVNIRSIKQTTGIQNLDSYHYLNELIPVPDINEQQAIVDYLDQETSRIDNLVSKTNQAIEKLQEYRSALITAAVTGKIDVRPHAS